MSPVPNKTLICYNEYAKSDSITLLYIDKKYPINIMHFYLKSILNMQIYKKFNDSETLKTNKKHHVKLRNIFSLFLDH